MLALWCVSRTGGVWAQGISVPLGSAAGFGLLSGGTLSTDSTGVYVTGKAGAAGATSGTITASGGLLRANVPAMAPAITLALQDLAAARAYCTALPAQPLGALLAGQTLLPGAYTIAGGATLGVRQTLTLTGDTAARYVFNITGGLHLDSGAFVLSGQVAARHIYWNVTGAVTLAPEVLLPGIVLGNDVIAKAGDQFGTVTLLTTGNALSIFGLDPVAGNNQFAAPTSQPPACPTPPLPTGPNIAPNFSFEDACRCPARISNMEAPNSDVLSWYSAINTTPDYFRSCPNSGNDPFSNILGHQPPRNGGLGMVGVITNREYVQVGLLPLQPNRPYYAECFWSLAESAQFASSALGLYLGAQTGDLGSNALGFVYRENGQLVVPQVESPVTVPLLNTDDATWTPVGGFLTTPAPNQPAWRYLTLGVFRIPDSNPGPNRNRFPSNIPGARNTRPYYYLDDVTLWALPLAPLPVTVGCAGTPFVLGWATPPALPTTLTGRVTYEWTGPGIVGTITGTQFTMTLPNYGTYDYTLKVIIDQGGANPRTYTYPQPIRVTVLPTPTLTLTPSATTVCQGQPVTLTATAVPGATYIWQQQVITGTNLGPTTPVPGATGAATCTTTPTGSMTLYTVTATLGACQATSVQVVVQMLPTPTLTTLTGPPTVCQGQPLTLTTTSSNCPTCPRQWTRQLYGQQGPIGTPFPLQGPGTTGPTLTETLPAGWAPPDIAYIGYSVFVTSPVTGCRSVVRDILVQLLRAPEVTIESNGQAIDGNTLTLTPNALPVPLQGIPTGGTWTDPAGVLICPTCPTTTLDPTQVLPGASFVLTYSYTSPVTGCTASAWVQIRAAPAVLDCPLADCPDVVELPGPFSIPPGPPGGWVYTENPFLDADVCYHITQSIRLRGGRFFLSGCRLLLDPGVSITIGDNADFYAEGVTLTAACEQMWGGLLLDLTKVGRVSLRNCTFSHSLLGVTGVNKCDLEITGCSFFNNRIGVQLAPVTGALPFYYSTCIIQNNLFSVVGPFKQPLTSRTSRSDVHLNLSNNDLTYRPITNNTFEHALIGVYGGIRQNYLPFGPNNVPAGATLNNNTFTDCLMGGVVRTNRWVGDLTHNHFALTNATWAPSTYRKAFAADYQLPAVLTGRPVGAYLPGAVAVTGNEFTSPTAPASFGPLTAALARPVGLWLPHTGNIPTGIASTITRNTFGNLETAILAHQANHQVVDNTVLDCRYGLRIQPPTGSWTGPFNPATGLYVSCNTFRRTVPLGRSADIALDQGVEVAFAHLDPQTNAPQPGTNGTPYDGMKNLFVNTGSAGGNLDNRGFNILNPSPQSVVYKTFAPVSPGVPTSNTSNIITGGSVVVTDGGLQGVMPGFDALHSCNEEDSYSNGIQARQGSASGVMESPTGKYLILWPNPANEQLLVSLDLPATLTSGELLIRDGIQGQVVRRIALRVGQTEASLDVRHLPAGLYQCSLLLEGRSVAAVRLQVTH